VRIAKETDVHNENKYELLVDKLKGEDTYFKSGFVGLFTDGTLGAFFDGFKV